MLSTPLSRRRVFAIVPLPTGSAEFLPSKALDGRHGRRRGIPLAGPLVLDRRVERLELRHAAQVACPLDLAACRGSGGRGLFRAGQGGRWLGIGRGLLCRRSWRGDDRHGSRRGRPARVLQDERSDRRGPLIGLFPHRRPVGRSCAEGCRSG